jgi:dihydroorotate dehydrogenase
VTYRALRTVGFRLDPERVHAVALRAHRWLRPVRRPFPVNRVRVMGLEFPNVVGLAGGYDKNAVAWRGLGALGFGHVEVGTVTPLPQPGNPKPRIFRLPADAALINRMGFPSDGAEAVVQRLGGIRDGVVVGVSIGPNGFTDVEQAAADYETLIERFASLADYFSVNVSSPNTEGLRSLQSASDLEALLARIVVCRDAQESVTPVAVKLSPDIAAEDLPSVIAAIEGSGVDGVIVTNTSVARPELESDLAGERGGLSGAPLRSISQEMLHRVRELTALPLIASGGIMSTADARARLDAGADLVQLYTGFVYEGPDLVREIAGLEPNPDR